MNAISRALQRGFYPLVAVAIILLALFHARGFSALVSSTIDIAPRDGPGVDVPRAQPERSADAILARNPFDSTPRDEPVSCDGFRVHAIVAFDDDASSFIALSRQGQKPVLRRAGSEAFGKRVRAVRPDRVVLGEGERVCDVPLVRPAYVPAAPRVEERAMPGIERVSATEVHVDRALAERMIANPSVDLRGIPVAWANGLRIVRVPPESAAARLGLESGDVITSVNGITMNDPESALTAYAQLRFAPRLRLVIQRRGASTQLDVVIR